MKYEDFIKEAVSARRLKELQAKGKGEAAAAKMKADGVSGPTKQASPNPGKSSAIVKREPDQKERKFKASAVAKGLARQGARAAGNAIKDRINKEKNEFKKDKMGYLAKGARSALKTAGKIGKAAVTSRTGMQTGHGGAGNVGSDGGTRFKGS